MGWLEENAPGYANLENQERDAIAQFLLLWSLFEAKVLGTHANVGAIIEATERWSANGRLNEETFGLQLEYFRGRYVSGDGFTYHFQHLHLPDNDKLQLVEKVLRDENPNAAEIASVILMIVYRYRNNLFHGVKWAYELRGQFENFTQANLVLQRAIELDGDR